MTQTAALTQLHRVAWFSTTAAYDLSLAFCYRRDVETGVVPPEWRLQALREAESFVLNAQRNIDLGVGLIGTSAFRDLLEGTFTLEWRAICRDRLAHGLAVYQRPPLIIEG